MSSNEKVNCPDDTKNVLASENTPIDVASSPQSENHPAKVFEPQQNEQASVHELPTENKSSVRALVSNLKKEIQSVWLIEAPVSLDKVRRLNELTLEVLNTWKNDGKKVVQSDDQKITCVNKKIETKSVDFRIDEDIQSMILSDSIKKYGNLKNLDQSSKNTIENLVKCISNPKHINSSGGIEGPTVNTPVSQSSLSADSKNLLNVSKERLVKHNKAIEKYEKSLNESGTSLNNKSQSFEKNVDEIQKNLNDASQKVEKNLDKLEKEFDYEE